MSVRGELRRSLGEKLMVSGGVAALAIAGGNIAEAGIVASTTTPISPPSTNGRTPWDVDGDGLKDFDLRNDSSSSASMTERNGGRLVAPNTRNYDAFQKLAAGFVVGSAMAGFRFFTSAQGAITVTDHQNIGGDAADGGWAMGDTGFIGFKFTSGTNTYYGWAEVHIHGSSPAGSGYTITRAYYNNTPGASIIVGDTSSAVPEPSTCVLALLAAGGVVAYKGRRKQAAV